MASASIKLLLGKKGEKNGAASNLNGNPASIVSPRKLLRKMLENGSGDWEMVASNGRALKFHQVILSEQVPHFRTLFSHKGTLEWVNKRIVIAADMDTSGKAAEALLRYVYFQDSTLMTSDFKLCCDLIRLGHFYEIPALIQDANEIIRKPQVAGWKLKPSRVEDLWKLYQNVWLWEEEHPSKKNLLDDIAVIIKRCCKLGSSETLLPVTKDVRDPLLLSRLMVALAEEEPVRPVADTGTHRRKYREEELIRQMSKYSSQKKWEEEEEEAPPLFLFVVIFIVFLLIILGVLWWLLCL